MHHHHQNQLKFNVLVAESNHCGKSVETEVSFILGLSAKLHHITLLQPLFLLAFSFCKPTAPASLTHQLL